MLKENNFGGLTLPNCKTYYKVAVYYAIVHCWKKYQWNRIECPEVDPHKYTNFWQRSKDKAIIKDSLQQMVLEQLDIHMQKNESRQRPYTLNKR